MIGTPEVPGVSMARHLLARSDEYAVLAAHQLPYRGFRRPTISSRTWVTEIIVMIGRQRQKASELARL